MASLIRRSAGAVILATFLCVSALTAAPAHAQDESTQEEGRQPARVQGWVLDRESGGPIQAVEVRLIGEAMNVGRLTDRWGYFAFARVPPGDYELVLSHIAYGTRADSIEIVGGDVHELQVRLAMQPIELEPLVVDIVRWQVSPRLWGFYDRVESGWGSYITREEIERRQPLRVTYMIAELPGVTMIDPPGPGNYIVLNRYKRFDPSGRPGPCFPVVYLDGMRVGNWSLDDLLFPGDVEGVEVYKGLGEYPGEFASPDARCGVVAVWTRSAPPSDLVDSGTPLWRKLAIGGGLALLALLLVF